MDRRCRTTSRSAFFVGIKRIVLELVVEAGPVHPLKGLVLVAVPFDQLQLDKDKAILMSSATTEQLKTMPEYKKDQEGYSIYPRDRPIGGATQ